MVQAFRLCKYAFKESKASGIGFIAGLRSAEFWQRAKPSQVVAKHGDKPSWMTFDDRTSLTIDTVMTRPVQLT